MALVKTGGQTGLQKVTEETLQERLDRLSAGPTTSAAATTALGATPDQAKMAGAGNRKQAVLKQAIQPRQTVEAAKEKAKAPGELTAQEQAELEAAKKLAGLSGVSSKLGQIAEQRLSGAGTGVAQRQYKTSAVDKVVNPITNPSGNASVKQALLDYANDPTKREAALATLANSGVMPEGINTLLEEVDTVLNRGVQTQALAGSDIESAIQGLGYASLDDLAATLGRPAGSLAQMALPDIQAAIEQKRAELVNRQAATQAKATGSGLGAEAARQEVARFTTAGGMAQLKEAARPTIDFKAKVKVGDTEYDVENILKDEEFSNVIEQWLAAAPEERAKIIPDNWPLSDWLKNNETSLKVTEAQSAQAGKEFMAAQAKGAELKDLSEGLLADVVPGYEKGKFYTDAQLTDMANKWKSSPLYGLNARFLNNLKPDEITAAKGMERSDLEFLANDLPGIMAGPAGQVLDAFGISKGKNIYNKSDIEKIKKIKTIQEKDPVLLNQSGWAKGLPLETLATLADNPSLKTEVQELREDQMSFADMGQWTNDTYINRIFGGPQQVVELNSRMAELAENAQYGDNEAAIALAALKKMDTDKDGDIDLADAKSLAESEKIRLSSLDIKEELITGDKYKDGYTTAKEKQAKDIATGLGYKPTYNAKQKYEQEQADKLAQWLRSVQTPEGAAELTKQLTGVLPTANTAITLDNINIPSSPIIAPSGPVAVTPQPTPAKSTSKSKSKSGKSGSTYKEK